MERNARTVPHMENVMPETGRLRVCRTVDVDGDCRHNGRIFQSGSNAGVMAW